MLTITRQSDYGILLISYLAGKDNYVPLSKIVKEIKLPSRFLARIAAKLAKSKIIVSREGKIGGYKLTDKVNTLTLYQYLKIFEKDIALTKCADLRYKCPWEKLCHHKSFFQHHLHKVIVSAFKRFKLKDLFNISYQ